jgi:hypothetical protein
MGKSNTADVLIEAQDTVAHDEAQLKEKGTTRQGKVRRRHQPCQHLDLGLFLPELWGEKNCVKLSVCV